jgi:hypothetical protein
VLGRDRGVVADEGAVGHEVGGHLGWGGGGEVDGEEGQGG